MQQLRIRPVCQIFLTESHPHFHNRNQRYMQHTTATAWRQHWFTIRASRCEIAWRKEREGVLRVHLRLASQRALFLSVFSGMLLLMAVSVAVLAYMHVDHSFIFMALSPFVIFFLLLTAYKSTFLTQGTGFHQEPTRLTTGVFYVISVYPCPPLPSVRTWR